MGAFALVALAGGRAWAQQVVISQIYSGSNATGSAFNRDYVELYNRGSTPVSVVGWSLQAATSTGVAWTKTNLTAGSIAPGGYFLVQMTTSGTIGAALPTPDFVSTTNTDLASGTGKVALVGNQTTLATSSFFLQGASGVIDFVGYGQTTPAVGPNGFEGSGGTPGAGTVALAIFRANNGCQDTQDNAVDFLAPAPAAPRNSASPTFSCTPTGACCNGVSCSYVDAGTCTGSYQGDFTFCGNAAYTGPATPANAFDDISTTGTPLAALDNADDTAAAAMTISPAFPMFGKLRNQVTINSNGYLAFLPAAGGASSAQMRGNLALPSGGALPNEMVAPLWDDLVVRTTLVAGAHVYTEQKSSPNRFIVQWNKVSTFNAGTVTPDNLTFEAILYQDTGAIEFRYGTISSVAAVTANAGIEDLSGTIGNNIPQADFQAGNVAKLFSPVGVSTCSPPANDFCATATALPVLGTGPTGISGTNALATLDGGSTACGVPCDKDVWFAFQPSISGSWSFSTCVNTTQDTVIEVYDACGGNLVACDDDSCGLQSSLTTSLVSSNSYRVRLASKGAGAAGGAFTLVVVQPPPANDTCAGAVVVTSTPYIAPSSECNGPTATDDLDVSCNSSTGTTSNRGVWFTYTAVASGNLSLTQTSVNDTFMAVFTGGCGNLTQIACSDPNTLGVPVTAGTQYWILVGMWSPTAVPTLPYGMTIDFVAPLTNDACSGAILVGVPSVTNGTTVSATVEVPAPPACAGPLPGGSQSFTLGTSPGVWYTVVSPIDQTLTADTLLSAFDTRLFIYDGSGGCGALTCVTANDDAQGSPFQSKAAWHAFAGVPYYILVTPFLTTTGAFTLSVNGNPTPANDDCGTATPISGVSGSIPGTTFGATALNNTATSANPSCNPSYSMFDVWYEWTAPCGGDATFTTCGSFDTLLSVHLACADLTTSNQVVGACNDNGAVGCSPGSSVTVAVTAGVTYKIRVAAAISSAPMGNFTLTWSLPDADADGVADACDGCPLDPAKIAPGTCGCGVPDTDTDGDGTADCNDGCPNDPAKITPGICGCGVSDADSDGDGTVDCNDGCPSDPLKVAPGICGCGVSDADSDGDGTVDCNDGCPSDPLKVAPGICGCGVSDADSDGDGTVDCNDGCPSDPLKVAPGACGCGTPDTDTDGDGTADCNDGCPNDPLKVAPGACGCGTPDTDTDGDGFADCQDNCPTVSNPSQADQDMDGFGDVCDNCVSASNPDQADCDGDGVGDVCAILGGAPDCNNNGIPDSCDVGGGGSSDANFNGIPDECELNGGTPYCFGDGSANGGPDCPCSNNVPIGTQSGCINSTSVGATMLGSGSTSVSSDQLLLSLSNLPPNKFCVLVQGDIAQVAGFGTQLGDGLLCVNTNLRRLGVRNSGASGSILIPSGPDLPISTMGLVPPTGATRYYQGIYRNLAGPCGTGTNGTNGVSVIWVP
ncbi:MAG: lamin tail domain-containing protein [Planctomycetes bacterium]|nr:lamin tail domain-containing protein [Planctomycetota bacterium]